MLHFKEKINSLEIILKNSVFSIKSKKSFKSRRILFSGLSSFYLYPFFLLEFYKIKSQSSIKESESDNLLLYFSLQSKVTMNHSFFERFYGWLNLRARSWDRRFWRNNLIFGFLFRYLLYQNLLFRSYL